MCSFAINSSHPKLLTLSWPYYAFLYLCTLTHIVSSSWNFLFFYHFCPFSGLFPMSQYIICVLSSCSVSGHTVKDHLHQIQINYFAFCKALSSLLVTLLTSVLCITLYYYF